MPSKDSWRKIVPDWVPRGDPSGLPPPGTESEASKPQQTQLMVAGKDSVIPIVYGGPERRGGLIYWVGIESTPFQQGLIAIIIFCEGPVQSIGTVYINDEPAPSPFSPYQYTLYDGTQTTVDAVAAYNIPGWNETLNGYCYGVFHFSAGFYHNFPRVTVQISGKKIYDPRSATTAWSDNPALIIRDFVVNQAGKSIDNASVIAAANACDTLVGTAPNQEKFSRLTISIAEKKSTSEWLEILRAHLPGWVVDHGSTMSITVDASGHSVSHTFDSTNIDTDQPPRLFKRGSADRPDIVEVGYTDTTTTPWATRYASAGSGTSKTRIELPGIRTYSQAKRFATTRLNHYALEGVEGEIGVFDYGLKVMPGDLAQITESAFGWTNKQVRVLSAQDRGHGRWTIRFRIYDPAAYSDSVVTAPTWPQTDLPLPTDSSAITGLSLTQAQEGTGRNIITATWNPTSWALFRNYYAELWSGSTLMQAVVIASNAYWQTIPVVDGAYTVKVFVDSTMGTRGPVSSSNITVTTPSSGPYGSGVVRYDKIEIDDSGNWLDMVNPGSGDQPTWNVHSSGARLFYRRPLKDWVFHVETTAGGSSTAAAYLSESGLNVAGGIVSAPSSAGKLAFKDAHFLGGVSLGQLSDPYVVSTSKDATGSLASGTWEVGITSLDYLGNESFAQWVTVTSVPASGRIYVNIVPIAGAKAYQLYLSSNGGTNWTKLTGTVTNTFQTQLQIASSAGTSATLPSGNASVGEQGANFVQVTYTAGAPAWYSLNLGGAVNSQAGFFFTDWEGIVASFQSRCYSQANHTYPGPASGGKTELDIAFQGNAAQILVGNTASKELDFFIDNNLVMILSKTYVSMVEPLVIGESGNATAGPVNKASHGMEFSASIWNGSAPVLKQWRFTNTPIYQTVNEDPVLEIGYQSLAPFWLQAKDETTNGAKDGLTRLWMRAEGNSEIFFEDIGRGSNNTYMGLLFSNGALTLRAYNDDGWSTKGDRLTISASGTVTIPTADINGGTIDGAVIGGGVGGAAAGTFTTLTGGTGSRITDLSIGADSDVLLYEGATNQLNFRTGASGAYKYFTFDASGNMVVNNGNLGIGTTSPSFRLSLGAQTALKQTSIHLQPYNIGGADNEQRISNGLGASVYSSVVLGFNDLSGGIADKSYIAFRTYEGYHAMIQNSGEYGVERMRLDSSGNLGIGVSPSTRLHVAGATSGAIHVNDTGQLYGTALHNNSGSVSGTTNQYIASGTYTPSLTNTSNIAASTAAVCQWIRVGNVVSVSGTVSIDATAAGIMVMGMSLPIASNLTAASQCGGTACAEGTSTFDTGYIVGDTTNDRATFNCYATVTANNTWTFHFQYLVA